MKKINIGNIYIKEKMYMEALEKAGINGALTGLASGVMFGFQSAVKSPIGNQNIPFPIFTGLIGASGSLAGDVLHLVMKDTIPVSKKWNDKASVISGMAINGMLFGGLLYAYQPAILNDYGMVQAILVGAGSEFVGSAGYTYLKENSWL